MSRRVFACAVKPDIEKLHDVKLRENWHALCNEKRGERSTAKQEPCPSPDVISGQGVGEGGLPPRAQLDTYTLGETPCIRS